MNDFAIKLPNSQILSSLAHRLLHSHILESALVAYREGKNASIAVPPSARPFLQAMLWCENPHPTLLITAGEQAAHRLAEELAVWIPREYIYELPLLADPPWQMRTQSMESAKSAAQRARSLYALDGGKPCLVVASARALLRKLPPPDQSIIAPLRFVAGEYLPANMPYENLPLQLTKYGYERCDTAGVPATFALHGDTVDIYPANMAHPIRIELFGDEVESIRSTVASTGQSVATLPEVEIHTACEFAPTPDAVKRAREQVLAGNAFLPFVPHGSEHTQTVTRELELLAEGVRFVGIDRWLPLLFDKPVTPLAYLPPNAKVTIFEPRSLFDDIVHYRDALLLASGAPVGELDKFFAPPTELSFAAHQNLTLLSVLGADNPDARLEVKHAAINGSEERLLASVKSNFKSGALTLLAHADKRVRESLALLLSDAHLPFVDATHSKRLKGDAVNLVNFDIPTSLIIPKSKLALITPEDVAASASARRSKQRAMHKHDITLTTFPYKPGDYVVHENHGIALFKEIVRRSIAGVERDYLFLQYAQEDKLFTPVEQIDKITRYVGPEGSAPRLTRLNTSDWSRATTKARTSARKLAFDLVDLYSRRAQAQGTIYEQDDELQFEMEQDFEYDETPDQLTAIADVKADMMASKPMDRLICGDVGFGKTEVAIRAAFKAVRSGKQVMLLCPTTILAQQHYTTFSERFERFGVGVDVLSRFRTAAQQRRILEGFAHGGIDLLIGTHRLLSADVNPKDLGLIIIDEEQRFGVQHKEHLKNLREQIDVLALSATPIPRTLQMSLSGVRDMSLIDTPPMARAPIKVQVGQWNEDTVSAAIRHEMARGGQVYYVSNRVKTIDDAVNRVIAAAPEARVAVAHGQMSANELEHVMEGFAANEYDVLVATTIIESGIDNPHSNTLIIEDAQRLGLAQLYQLKGRVGRSHAQAYAYFLFPRDDALTPEAAERLMAIDEHQQLGSGIHIAMRDLEIRGAGALLGGEQSGMLSSVGFDLYAQMIAEAVEGVRSEKPEAHPDVRIDLPIHYYLPDDYVAGADERVLYYRRVAAATSTEQLDVIKSNLEKAYGALPQAASNLLDRAALKIIAADLGVTNISMQRARVVLEPLELDVQQKQYASEHRATYMVKSQKLLVTPATETPILSALITFFVELTSRQEESVATD